MKYERCRWKGGLLLVWSLELSLICRVVHRRCCIFSSDAAAFFHLRFKWWRFFFCKYIFYQFDISIITIYGISLGPDAAAAAHSGQPASHSAQSLSLARAPHITFSRCSQQQQQPASAPTTTTEPNEEWKKNVILWMCTNERRRRLALALVDWGERVWEIVWWANNSGREKKYEEKNSRIFKFIESGGLCIYYSSVQTHSPRERTHTIYLEKNRMEEVDRCWRVWAHHTRRRVEKVEERKKMYKRTLCVENNSFREDNIITEANFFSSRPAPTLSPSIHLHQ